MKVKKVRMITEAMGSVNFENSTQDQFPYIESAINILDNNFKWWKENYSTIEELIQTNLEKSLSDNMEHAGEVTISSRFTMFHGPDDVAADVMWTGPAIVYTLDGVSSKIVRGVKDAFPGRVFEGHKIFANDNDLIILFG